MRRTLNIGLALISTAVLVVPIILSATQVAEVYRADATRFANGHKLVVDKGGGLHVCFLDKSGSNYVIKYGYSSDQGTNWTFTSIVSNLTSPSWPALAVTANSAPYNACVAYFGDDNRLRVWKKPVGGSATGPATITSAPSGMILKAPSIIINNTGSKGLVYYNNSANTNTQLFNLSDLTVPSNWQNIPVGLYLDGNGLAAPSACKIGSTWEMALSGNYVAALGVPEQGSGTVFQRRLDRTPWGTPTPEFNQYYWSNVDGISSQGGYVSVGSHGSDAMYVFTDATNYSAIRCRLARKGSNSSYDLNDPDQYTAYLINGADAGSAHSPDRGPVQIAESYLPLSDHFVAWEKSDASFTDCKIYYAFKKASQAFSTSTAWALSGRVSTCNSTDTFERFPQTAWDVVNKKAWVMWTQERADGTGDTTIQLDFVSFASLGMDTVYVTDPTNGAVWARGTTKNITWDRGTTNSPTNIYIAYTTDCSASPISWTQIKQLTSATTPNNSALQYAWAVGKDINGKMWQGASSSKCMVRVIFEYINGTTNPRDTGYSGVFKIPYWWVETADWFVDQKTRAMSSGSNGNPWDLGNSEGILGYIYPQDTFDLPFEFWSLYSADTAILQFSADGGETYTNVKGCIPSDSSIIDTSFSDDDTFFVWNFTDTLTWVSPATPNNSAYLRMMVIDTAYDTCYSDAEGPYYITAPDGYQFSTYCNQTIASMNDDADKIGLVYTGQNSMSQKRIMYLESSDGTNFSVTDTISTGQYGAFSNGAGCWATTNCDSLMYSYQLNDTFSTPYAIVKPVTVADTTRVAPAGILSENDTTHIIARLSWKKKINLQTTYYYYAIMYYRFPEGSPTSTPTDTLFYRFSTSASELFDTLKIAPSIIKCDSTLYGAISALDTCVLFKRTSSTKTTSALGKGHYPHLSKSDGNIACTYLGYGDTTLIRLWRYQDDTTWIERDTFYLDTVANFLCGEEKGSLFGVQYAGSGRKAHVYGRDPLSESFLLQGYYTGYYDHPYIDDKAEEFAWISNYADYADDSAYTFLHTIRRPLYVPIVSAYLESDTKRSPFTVYRDTCVEYREVTIDSGRDSLKYKIACLDNDLDYSIRMEFYHEVDSTANLQITLECTADTIVDTIDVAADSTILWYAKIPSSTDTVDVKVKRLSSSTYTFVPISRIWVQRRSSEGLYSTIGINEPPEIKPQFCLYQPFPNPFTDQATIRYSLPYATSVNLNVYDVSGRLVKNLVQGNAAPGVYTVNWKGIDSGNRKCPSGIYFVRFAAGKYTSAKKMVLIK